MLSGQLWSAYLLWGVELVCSGHWGLYSILMVDGKLGMELILKLH